MRPAASSPWKEGGDSRLSPCNFLSPLNLRNGLALSRLRRKAFDAGILATDEDLRVCVSRRIQPTGDGRFHEAALQKHHGAKITIPKKFVPEQNFLDCHRGNIFEKRLRPP